MVAECGRCEMLLVWCCLGEGIMRMSSSRSKAKQRESQGGRVYETSVRSKEARTNGSPATNVAEEGFLLGQDLYSKVGRV